MVLRLRFHGRGGEGVKLASRIVSRAAFLDGRSVQDSPVYGAERRGAPVVAFTRISATPIQERGYVVEPDAVVVMDESLVPHGEAAVLDGVTAQTLVLLNSARSAAELRERYAIPGEVVSADITGTALTALGHPFLSAVMASFTIKAVDVAPRDALEQAIQIELAEAGLGRELITGNLNASRQVFDETPRVGVRSAPEASRGPVGSVFMVPHLCARVAAPSIAAEATSALRTTEGWRTFRPVIDQERCTRCFICFALCPEGAIHLDTAHFPHVDYAHCKGCLVCVSECPPHAITEVREPVP
jgi:pyruvate ferredoxin oxidoreductase gamma subunit